MTQQHITQEQANELAAKELFKSRDAFVLYLCNAAIQHYLDQRKAELPALPDKSIDELWAHLNTWSESPIEACDEVAELCDNEIKTLLQAYGLKCAAHARELALSEAIAICRRNAQNTSADELEVLKGK